MPEPSYGFASTARLITPPVALASCVRAYVVRNTTGRPLLPPAQRLNRFPATLLCGISWFIEGSSQIVASAQSASPGTQTLPRAVLGGPQTRPCTSHNPGPVHVFMVMFFPQALQALTGIDMSQHINRQVALDTVLDGQWLALSQQILAAPDDDARMALVDQFLAPRWHAARAAGAAPGSALGDWINSLTGHVAAGGGGRSTRNLERRIKVLAGQPLRGLRRLSRAERSFVDTRAAMQAGTVSWIETAASGGFSDQAHLCRETRAITGHTPTELARLAMDDESYWLYRIWA